MIIDRMRVIVPVESHLERLEVDPVALRCVSLCFFDLTDHPIIHIQFAPFQARFE
jgi:hypothetical protein